MNPTHPNTMPPEIDADVTDAHDAAVRRCLRPARELGDREQALIGDVRALVLSWGLGVLTGRLRFTPGVPSPVQTLSRAMAIPGIFVPTLRVLTSALAEARAGRENPLDDEALHAWLDANSGHLSRSEQARHIVRAAIDIWAGVAPFTITVLAETSPAEATPEALELMAGLVWHAATGE